MPPIALRKRFRRARRKPSNFLDLIRKLIQHGLRHFDLEDWEEARALFEKAREKVPDHPVPYFFLALSHLAACEDKLAARCAEEGLKRSPKNVLGHNLLALLAFREGRVKEALAELKRFPPVEHLRVQAFLILELEKALQGIAS